MAPEDLRFTAEHEWVRPSDDDVVRLGITDFAQEALGDVVYVSLPAEGDAVSKGQPLGEVESTKSVSEIYAPFDGEVVARNDSLDAQPDLLNSDPYGDGWLVAIRPADPGSVSQLLTATDYDALVAGSA